MKRLLIIMITTLSLQANTIMIDNIQATLKALSYEASHTSQVAPRMTYDPFYHDKPQKRTKTSKKVAHTATAIKRQKKGLILSMVFNQKAFINGKWYKKNDKVAHYVLNQVNQDSVVLRRKHKNIVLKLATNEKLLVKTEVR